MIWFVRVLWTEAWPAGGWVWAYRAVSVVAATNGTWVGIQLIRRRPKAYHTGMVVSGFVAIGLLAVMLWSIFDSRFTSQVTLSLAVAAAVLAAICGLLRRDWCRIVRSGSDKS